MGSILDLIAEAIKEVLGPLFSIFKGTPIEDEVEKVREITVGLCGFLPTVDSVTQMLQASNPIVRGVVNIAKAICAAVSSDTARGLVMRPKTVNGIKIEGEWVKK